MRRLVIALLALVEAAVGCAIMASSLALARDLQRSETVGRVAHAVVSSTHQLAAELQTGLRRRG
jgi:hypothetical protein